MAPLSSAERTILLDVAEHSIGAGLDGGGPLLPALDDLPDVARAPAAVFVTLHVCGRLNGCIGGVEALDPLAHAVARHAWSSAFGDPRLPPLRWADVPALDVEISVLSELELVPASTAEELLSQLRPGVDGVLLTEGRRRGLFLPAVWDQIADPATFLRHLQAKAGLPPGRWAASTRAERFTVEKFGRRAEAIRAA
jgi:uncharacterized protein